MIHSEFCMVDYIENENIVFLTWKKFCKGEDYRNPVKYALELLRSHKNSNFVVDARNGFEDDKEDVEWGFSEFIPNLAKTDCKYVVFIMNEFNDIEDEMDMWTKEFIKHFTIIRVNSYEDAINRLHSETKMISLNVVYTVKDGMRDEFYKHLCEKEIIKKSKEETANVKYNYYFDVENPNNILLLETWKNTAAQQEHLKSEHYGELQKLKLNT